MKLHILSDIHIEFLHISTLNLYIDKIKSDADILILAGDIGNPFGNNYLYFLREISIKFKKVFIISGNHEYYNKDYDIDDINNQIIKTCNDFSNIIFLNNSYYDYNGYRFIGSTLWSLVDNTTEPINDTKKIKNMNIDFYNKLHTISKNYIKQILDQSKDQKCVIITHHVPSYKLIDDKFKTDYYDKYNKWFYSDLDDLFTDQIKCWIYGHTHMQSHKIINGIDFICNPIGYRFEINSPDYNKTYILN